MKKTTLFVFAFLFISFGSIAQYKIDPTKSTVRWYGYYLFSFGEHYGTIAITEGHVNTSADLISAGKVTIDMNSITTLDMPANDGGNSLSDHLKSADFFDAPQFPEASFEITEVSKIKDASPDGPNVEVTGFLTLKGVKNAIKLPATMRVGDVVTMSAKFKFDRTKWNVRYNSGKFFSDAGDGAISDAIGIELNITANKISTK